MAPVRRLARVRADLFRASALTALCLAGSLAAAVPAQALRIVNYNILNFGTSSFTTGRFVPMRNVIAPLNADVIVVQELTSSGGHANFLNQVLNVIEPGEWAAAPYTGGPNTNNGLYYKPAKVSLLGSWFWLPPDNLRYVNCYRLMPVGYSAEAAEIRIYSQHLKASTGSTNQQRRLTDAISIRDSMNAMPAGTHAILTGDFNIYSGAEPAFTKFLESQTINLGRLYDPLNAPLITWNNAGLASIHTQSPCLDNGCPSAPGGLDDRFDMFLPTYNMNDGSGLELIASTYIPVGNDGLHYDDNITDLPTIPEGPAYANALIDASDHLPVRVDVQLPAKIYVFETLDLGSVIQAGSAELFVEQSAPTLPSDSLHYGFSAPVGFAAPVGTFALAAGAAPVPHAISTTAGVPGARAGDLMVASNDPDTPSTIVALTANVLDHALPSLDSVSVLLADVVDFGLQIPGEFENQPIRVHNLGYSSVQAQLDIDSATITGGDGRFSLVGGFSPVMLAGTGTTINVAFNGVGATGDSLYTATLTLQTSDEDLPGATTLAPIVVTLQAAYEAPTVVAIGGPDLPRSTLLHAPFPNPLRGSSTIRFDLAKSTDVRLDVFDLTGRRVTTLASGSHAPGRYTFHWDGHGDRGSALGSGLYFIRLSGTGLAPQTSRLAIIR